ncbi:MAG: hypothetical protein AB9907_14750 [Flexilinea sp.]
MRTKKHNVIENEMISSEMVSVIAPEEKKLQVRAVQFIAMFHRPGNYESERTIYCTDRAELDQLIASEKEKGDRPGGIRIFHVERDIEFPRA